MIMEFQIPAKDVQIWPVTIAGWVTLFVAILGVLSTLYAYAKTLVHINGLGIRVDDIEKDHKVLEGSNTMVVRAVERITESQETLMHSVGETKQSAEACQESMQQYVRELGSKFDDLRREINTEGRLVGERLKGIETELELTRKGRLG